MNGKIGILSVALLTLLSVACEREGPAERTGEEVDRSVERAGEQIEEAGERVREEREP